MTSAVSAWSSGNQFAFQRDPVKQARAETISADTLKRRSIYELKAMDVDAEILIARTKEIRGYV